jgi:ABC-type antimicrobial peptide transport system permease subunit
VRDRFKANLLSEIDPLPEAFTIIPVREQGLAASQGATDFGEYFTYFSFFLVVAALLLATLFFRFGIEQRLREIGLLKAVGYAPRQIRNLFLTEGLALSILGSVLGVLGALVYGKFIMVGLRTWWVGAVGTIYLSLHVSSSSLAFGALGGIASTCLCIAWTLRTLASAPPRTLLTGTWILPESSTRRGLKGGGNRRFSLHLSPLHASIATGVVGGIFLVAALLQRIGETGGFFGAGILFLVSILALQMHWLGQRGQSISHVRGTGALLRLGCRNATHRPGRSVLCISLIALAAFIIVAVEAFRRAGQNTGNTLPTGTGGFPLFAQSLVPLFHDLNTAEGRDALGLSSSARWPTGNFQAFRFRVREGEDTSCLNLYQPQIPRIIAPTAAFLTLERFAFQNSLATDEAEKRNPWLLLEKAFPDGAVPVIGDASSLNYVLHRKLGQDWVLERAGSPPVLLRIVAALADSLFQRELLMSESNFKRLFPDEGGYRFFLINVPGDQLANATQVLEEQLADYGFDVLSTSDQLARFHQVENTYLSTFQALGGLGLLLGTLGLAIVLLRNVLERRQELALLRAIGYRSRHLAVMILAENALLLTGGLATGILCASLAITPALSARGGSLMALSLAGWLPAVLAAGLVSSTLATRAVLRFPLLESLRAE